MYYTRQNVALFFPLLLKSPPTGTHPFRDMCTDLDRFVFWSFCKVRVVASHFRDFPEVTRHDPKVQICSKTPNYVHMSQHFKVWIGTHAVAPPRAVTLPTVGCDTDAALDRLNRWQKELS
jgi:hypothetical protein